MSTLELVKTALRQRCAPEGNWLLTPAQCMWLTLKFVFCLLLGRAHKTSLFAGHDSHVVVAVTDSHAFKCGDWGTCYEWRNWCVGKGVFRNWWYFDQTDGAP